MNNDITLLRMSQVLAVVPVSRSTLWRWISNGDFPKPVEIGSTPFWRKCDIENVVNKQNRNNDEDLI